MWFFEIFKRNPIPYDEGLLKESDGHKIYYYQYGNPKGKPILSFHGGPGGSAKAKYAALFDLKKYRFISFDQRGCGKSTYQDLLEENTSYNTVSDAKNLLDYLSIKEQVILYGCSWGSTLALLFAEKYPQKISAIILAAVFLARKYDCDWVSSESERFYPDLWDTMRSKIKQNNILPEYRRLLFSKRKSENLKALKYIGNYEYQLGSLNPEFPKLTKVDEKELNSARIYFYYEKNHYFMQENQILKNINKIKNIKCLIIHNRLDFCCPVKQAWDLKKALPKSKLKIVADYGHISKKMFQETKKEITEFLKD